MFRKSKQNYESARRSDSLDSKNNQIITVLLCALVIPLSMSLWIINIIYSKLIIGSEGYDEPVVISPSRWLASCLIPIVVAVVGYKKKSVSCSGALLGFVVGFILTLSNYSFMVVLFTMFITSSKVTKYKAELKAQMDEDFKIGGQRNWVQVLCTGGMATQLGLLYLLDVGASERPIDFVRDYRASWLSMGVLGTFAFGNGDTWASELGPVLVKSDPFLITSWRRVPKGTNGGITFLGTLFSLLGGLVVGLAHYFSIIYLVDRATLAYAPSQWPLILYGALAGLLGSVIDSYLGATLQYTGLNNKGKIVTQASQAVKNISGRNILDNHSVNLISTVLMGLILPTISKGLWPL